MNHRKNRPIQHLFLIVSRLAGNPMMTRALRAAVAVANFGLIYSVHEKTRKNKNKENLIETWYNQSKNNKKPDSRAWLRYLQRRLV
jgi:hypothetical protein